MDSVEKIKLHPIGGSRLLVNLANNSILMSLLQFSESIHGDIGYFLDPNIGLKLNGWESWKNFELQVYNPQGAIFKVNHAEYYYKDKDVFNMYSLLWDDTRKEIERKKREAENQGKWTVEQIIDLLTLIFLAVIVVSSTIFCTMGYLRIRKYIKMRIKKRKDEKLSNNWNEVDQSIEYQSGEIANLLI